MFYDWLKVVFSEGMGLGLFVLIGLFFVGSFVLGFIDKKKVWYGFALFLVGFYFYAKFSCGPSLIDIYRMKPMAEKIANYIVKNGIPESLEDIPGLPYELEGCENIDDEKKCHYKKDSAYIVSIYIPITNELTLETFNTDSKTGIQYWFKKDNTKIILERKGNAYSSKTSGICNPMRQ